MSKKLFRAAYAMNFILQTALCLLTPTAIWMGLAWLLQSKCGLGRWVMALGIVLGVISGLLSMIRFLTASAHAIDPTEGSEKGESGHGA